MNRWIFSLSLASVVLLLLAAIFAPWLASYPKDYIDISNSFVVPGTAGHWLGTGVNGVDLWDQLLWGARWSLSIALIVSLVGMIVGTVLGIGAAYMGGLVDEGIQFLVEVVLSFPGILMAVAMAMFLGPGKVNVILALSVVSWVSFARLARALVLPLVGAEFVLAARAIGSKPFRVIWHHLLPQVTAQMLIKWVMSLSGIILTESSLSFLGVGLAPGEPSWGSLLAQGREYLGSAPHLVYVPGAGIFLALFSFYICADQLQRWLPNR